MNITIELGRWGVPWLISVGRWEWSSFRKQLAPGWRIERFPSREISEVWVQCGSVTHCFTRWSKSPGRDHAAAEQSAGTRCT